MIDSWYNPTPEEIEDTKRFLRLASPFQMASHCKDETFQEIVDDAVDSLMEEMEMKADNARINELCDIIAAALKPKPVKGAKARATEAVEELRKVTA